MNKKVKIIIGGAVVPLAALLVVIVVKVATAPTPVQRCVNALVAAEQQSHNRSDWAGIASPACQSLSDLNYVKAHYHAQHMLHEVIP